MDIRLPALPQTHRRARVYLLLAGVTLAALHAGCGGGSDPGPTPTAPSTSTVAATTVRTETATAASPSPIQSATTAAPTTAAAASPTPGATTVTAPPPAQPTPTAAPQPSSANVRVRAFDLAFDVATLHVPAGARVTATLQNDDEGVEHNLTFSLPGLPHGDTCKGPCTSTQTFTAPTTGSFFFLCTLHDMFGEVVVDG
ncbi:MAG: hypothetical protein ACRDHF_02260 [Tepidiformaceae bacterium]